MNSRRSEQGFALPTVVLAGLLTLMMLAVALTGLSGSRAALDEQYYSQLSREASEAGVRVAESCYTQVAATATLTQWPNSGTLDTGDDCYGAPRATATNCGTSSASADCYVVKTSNVGTTYSVGLPTVQGIRYTLSIVGKVSIFNQAGAITRNSTTSLKYNTAVHLVSLASGNDTTCIAQNGMLFCWGDNRYGQVGDGKGWAWGDLWEYNSDTDPNVPTGPSQTTPVRVTSGAFASGQPGQYVQAVATGMYHTCAIANTTFSQVGNAIYCWGSSAVGQAGTIDYDGFATPTLVTTSGLYNYTGITARNGTCVMAALKTDMTTVRDICWGENDSDESGETTLRAAGADITAASLPNPKLTMTEIQRQDVALPLTKVKDISSISDDFGCAIDASDGTGVPGVWCWGSNGSGQYGVNSVTRPAGAFTCSGCSASYRNAHASKAITTTGMTNPTMVRTNNLRVCAVNNGGASGDLFCWGNNEYAVGGVGSDYALTSATVQSTTPGGLMYYNGQALGTRLPHSVTTPVKVATGGITDVAMADHATCYLKQGEVYCFGHNAFGQLGVGNNYTYPCQAGVSGGCPTLTAELDTELQNQDETYYATNTRPSTDPYLVQGLLSGKTVVKIAGGNRHFCAVTNKDELYCWGDNNRGQLGVGDTTPRYAPARVAIPASVFY